MDMKYLMFRKNDLILYINMHFSIQSIIDRLFHGNEANIYSSYNIATLRMGWAQRKINPEKEIPMLPVAFRQALSSSKFVGNLKTAKGGLQRETIVLPWWNQRVLLVFR